MPSPSTPTEWYYDASTSRLLRLVAHLPPAGIGGALILVIGVAAAAVATNPRILLSAPALLFALLLVIGGPMSLAYLWPMLTDPDQRPSAAEFAGGEGVPFSLESVGTAAVSGAVVIAGLVALGVSPGVVYRLVVGCVLSSILVAVATTHGELDGDGLTLNRTDVPIARVAAVRSVRVRGFVVAWISYARRSGLLLPRVAVIPEEEAAAALSALEAGIGSDPGVEPPDRAVQAVVIAAGALFVGVAALAYASVDDPAVRLYVAAVIGGLGAFVCLLGVRGV